MSNLLASGRPSNLRTPTLSTLVESDVFDICNRVREIDPSIVIWANDEGHAHRFSIHALDLEGNEYLIMYADELDARILDELRYRKHIAENVPFEKRWAKFEEREAKMEAERDELQREQLYEKLGHQFYVQLDRCGFIQRPDSYRKKNKRAQAYRSQRAAA